VPLKTKKPGKQLSKKERHKIKSATPRRRIAVQNASINSRIFNEANAVDLIKKIFTQAKTHRAGKKKVAVAFNAGNIPKLKNRTEKKSVYRSVVSLGSLINPKTNTPIPLIFKTDIYSLKPFKKMILIERNPSDYTPSYLQKVLIKEKQRFEILKKLGIPVLSFSIPITVKLGKNKYVAGAIQKDLTQKGKFKVIEAVNLANTGIQNKTQLIQELNNYVKKIREHGCLVADLHKPKNIRPEEKINYEIQKCFLTIVNPKTNKGQLILADAEHIKLKNELGLTVRQIEEINKGLQKE
jgi:hypothetical protein